MVNYKCQRCGYETTLRANYKTHLQRKQICEPLYSDISIETLVEQLEFQKKREYKCDYCDRIFTSSQGKYQHKFHCKYKQKVQLENEKENKIIQLEKELEKLRSDKNTNINNIHNIQNNNIHKTIIYKTIIYKIIL